MKKIAIAFLLVLIPFATQAASITTNRVGTCKLINGGYWQQLSDGTWADPNDSINTCRRSSLTGGLTGLYGNTGLGTGSLLGGTTLGTMTQEQWLINCMLKQTFVSLQQCQVGYSMYGNQLGYPYNYTLPGALGYAQLGQQTNSLFFANNDTVVSASTGDSDKFGDLLIGASLGWLLNKIL